MYKEDVEYKLKKELKGSTPLIHFLDNKTGESTAIGITQNYYFEEDNLIVFDLVDNSKYSIPLSNIQNIEPTF
ncbi:MULTISPECIES: hypothetical protein [Staphylococcus]|uniref:hypothetical protein n=1 Tax=Staphylococcus TaxID=1279 RepID=UPI0008A88841|nr:MULTISPECIES: hypothetical protein [Staphylococcus]MBE7340799.1 hypothetical protein [Staphylococcus haemolyticus]MBE7352393.1 hypothetical protein [Staphylococcus haemolyticus]OHQ32607.1 hypothetical protein HMPREF2548_08945 [Staphylococcus sp. HMSC067G10]